MRYEFDKDGNLIVWGTATDFPAMFQPTWPDGTAWKKGEAEAWAEQLILSWQDPTADLPGESPSQPTKPRPIVEPTEPTETN